MHASELTGLGTMTRIVVLHVLLASLALLSMQAQAQGSAEASAKYDFDIPSMSLDFALKSFQERTGVRVSFLPDRLQPFYSSAIRGRFNPFEALELMLRSTALDVEWVRSDAVYIGIMTHQTLQRFAEAKISKYDGMGGEVSPSMRSYSLLLARIPLSDLIQPLSYYFGLQFEVSPSDEALLRTYVGPLDTSLTPVRTLDDLLEGTELTWEWVGEGTIRIRKRVRSNRPDVTVEASRMLTLEIDRAPGRVMAKDQIDALGVSSVAQVMQYLAQEPFLRAEGLRTDGAQGVQLRGLGSDTTLVLINGRRIGTTANLYDSNSFDLNTIPVVAVERIEVYLDATPFSVGADTIGGIVNVVLKSDARDPTIDLHYGTSEGGGRERRASFASGVSREAFRISAVLDYFQRDRLLGAERDRWRNQDYRRFGGTDLRSPDSNPGNVSSLTSANLPGLSARFAAVPSHPSGEVLSADDFLAGERNLESLFVYRSILPESERASAVLSGEWKFSTATQAFAELLYATRETVFSDFPASVSNAVVPANNPYNPFGVPVRVNFLLSAVERERISKNQFARGLVGIRGDAGPWKWEVTLLHTDDRAQLTTEGDLDFAHVMSALSQATPEQALNVFDDGPGGTWPVLRSVIAPAVPREYAAEGSQVGAQFGGDVSTWKAGTISALFGAQWAEFGISAAGVPLGTRKREITSGIAELNVPVVAGNEQVPVLAAVLQGRIDRISDLRTLANFQFRLDWQPHPDVRARGTYGTSYRAPSLYELYQPMIRAFAPITDPKRDNEIVTVPISFGGNPRLEPATAESWSLGLILTPERWDALSLTGTYWHTEVTDRLSPVDLSTVFGHEELFGDRLLRATPTAADIAAGRPGAITFLNVTSEGKGTLRASGVDVQAAWNFDTGFGQFTPELSATWMNEFRVLDWPGLPTVDRVAIASSLGTIPRWHGVAGLTWNVGALTVTAKGRYVSASEDVNLFQNRQTGRTIAAQAYFDLQASLQLNQESQDDASWRSVTITTGVNNLFNRQPRFAEIGASFGYDPSFGDLRDRFAYLRVTKSF